MAVKQKIPKWLELEEGERYICTFPQSELTSILLFLALALFGMYAAYQGFVLEQWDSAEISIWLLVPAFFLMISNREKLLANYSGNKYHLTSSKIVFVGHDELKWVRKLEEISFIAIKKKIIGGNVVVHFSGSDDPVISAYSIFPAAMAKEIQAACASCGEQKQEKRNSKESHK